MKIFVFVLALSMSIAMNAQASRWIVKNPKLNRDLSRLNVANHSFVQLKNQYLILEMKSDSRMSAQSLANFFGADSAFEDIKVVVDEPGEVKVEPQYRGWHTKALEYSLLNPAYNGQGIVVAVLDTGVDYKHPALEKRMWKNTKEIPDNLIDDDGNGLVDDYHGYNFNDKISDPMDTGSHGTHCAGSIAAEMHPETGTQGVAQSAQIMPLVIISQDYGGFLSSTVSAIKYATDNGAQILSNSWRVYESWQEFISVGGIEMLREAIVYSQEHNVIFVAASGNEKKNLDEVNQKNPIYPLSFEGLNIVGVTASKMNYDDNGNTTEESMADFSNYGAKMVSVVAPGWAIYSTVPGGWEAMSGTSMAAPIVSGVLARGLSKGYTPKEAIEKLKQTTLKNPYWENYSTHGHIEIKKYLE